YQREELLNKSARILYENDEDYEYVGREKYRQISERGTGTVETCFRRKDGSIIHVILSSTPIDPSDLSRGVTFTALDITERKRMEEERIVLQERLIQAQKMESVGRLAGGVAHDFNNMLQAILGYCHLATDMVASDSVLYANLQEIRKAAERSANLTRQLLAFARR
ncbi:MAG TPA: PAS domain S-box protein, partial [bacterium]|nr:PAS domain S-box protein [bacterium]